MQRINDAEQLGRAIRSQRKKLKLSQIELAAFAGVGVRFVRELEQGKPSCHLGKALAVAQMLGIRLSFEEG